MELTRKKSLPCDCKLVIEKIMEKVKDARLLFPDNDSKIPNRGPVISPFSFPPAYNSSSSAGTEGIETGESRIETED